MLSLRGMKKVLIVENDSDWRFLLKMTVEKAGHRAYLAMIGMEAVDLAISKQPDLILMALRLPGMTGDQATAQIKSHPKTKHIPIIIQTVFSVEEKGRTAMEAGAVGFLQKPISIRGVETVLNKYLSPHPPVPVIGEPLQRDACLAKTAVFLLAFVSPVPAKLSLPRVNH